MSMKEIIERLADAYGIEPDEDGFYDLDDYDWRSGCGFSRGWNFLSLKNVVEALVDESEWEEYWEEWKERMEK